MTTALVRLRAQARVLRDRVVDQQVRQLEAIRRGLVRGDVDVLVLGESSCILGRPGEPRTETIPQLLAARLGVRVASFVGAGFSPRMYGEALRLLGTVDARPQALVTSVCVRTSTSTHVLRHPIYSHERSYQRLRGLESARARLRSLGGVPRPSPKEYALFEALPVRTQWSGEGTIGGFRLRLKGNGPLPWPGDLEAVLFDYYHGELVEPDNPGLRQWRSYGELVRSYGVPAVGYRTPIPVRQGVAHHGRGFEELTQQKRAAVDTAVDATAGPRFSWATPHLDDEDFADCRDGTEHYAFSGRERVVEAVAQKLGG